MPNHITNIIKASPAVLNTLSGKEGIVDFNSIIPYPNNTLLDKVYFDGTEKIINFLCQKTEFLYPHFDNGAIFDKSRVNDKMFENFILMLRNKRECGFVGWYDFNCEKWGTKWNAYDIVTIEGGIQFDTAWSAPHPVITKLAEMFPNEKIEHLWADEDIGANLGHRIYYNGNVFNKEIIDRVDFALTVKGDDREYYRKNPETGLWERKEE